ncbi:MAG: recombinase family protein, partial [bacterium]
MIAAIYARKSTEQNGVSDEEKSITRQIEHAKAYATKKGWTVAEEHVYSDDGISGAEFVKRPGFLRLMNSVKPKPPFQVLVMSEESRLGREQIETAYALKQITDAGVRVFFYLEDRERTLDTAMDKVMLSLANFASEMEREKASQRTYDAMLRKAKALQVVGNNVYGYTNVNVFGPPGPDGKAKRLHVVRKVNEKEAAIIRRIFELSASGLGLTRIAKTLNAEGVQPPQRKRSGWCGAAIREMLYRPLYRGEIIWGKTQAIQRGGTTKSRKRPESEWLRLEAPELRIIDKDLWGKVHQRLEGVRGAYLRGTNGRLWGHPGGADLDSPYLLSGLAQCSVCGGALVGRKTTRGRYVSLYYVCVRHHKRGPEVCSNDLVLKQDALDSALLHALNDILDERMLRESVEKALRDIRSGQQQYPDRRLAITRELSLIEARLARLVEFVACGQGTDAVAASLRAEEARKKALAQEL